MQHTRESVRVCVCYKLSEEERRRKTGDEEDSPPPTPESEGGGGSDSGGQCSVHRTAKTRLIKWKDSPLFKGTQTDQNHTKQQKTRRRRRDLHCYYYPTHTHKLLLNKSSSPFPKVVDTFPALNGSHQDASTKLSYKRAHPSAKINCQSSSF